MVPGYSAGLTGKNCPALAGEHFTEKWDKKCSDEDKVIEKCG